MSNLIFRNNNQIIIIFYTISFVPSKDKFGKHEHVQIHVTAYKWEGAHSYHIIAAINTIHPKKKKSLP